MSEQELKVLEEFKLKVDKMDNKELESAWQGSADMIGMFAQKSWHCKPEEEQHFRDLAELHQKKQSIIQEEITRRH